MFLVLSSGQLINVRPFTNYSLAFVACTAGWCTEADDKVMVTTLEEGIHLNSTYSFCVFFFKNFLNIRYFQLNFTIQ